jgi:hypothetical protein
MTARGESAYRTFRAMDTSLTSLFDLASASGSFLCCRRARMPYGMAFNTPVTSSTRIFPISAARLSLPSRVGTAAMSAGIALMPSTKLMVVRGCARRQARRRQAHGANACDELRPTWKILISKWINT